MSDFPGSPVVKTPCFQCWGWVECVCDPWWERFHMWHGAARKFKKQNVARTKVFTKWLCILCLRKGIMMVNLCLSFWGTDKQFLKLAVPYYHCAKNV